MGVNKASIARRQRERAREQQRREKQAKRQERRDIKKGRPDQSATDPANDPTIDWSEAVRENKFGDDVEVDETGAIVNRKEESEGN